MKNLSKLGTGGKCFNKKRSPGKNPESLCLLSRMRQGCQLSTLLFNIVLEVKGIQIGKEEINYPSWQNKQFYTHEKDSIFKNRTNK